MEFTAVKQGSFLISSQINQGVGLMHINTVAFIKIPLCLAYVVCESHGLRFCCQTEVTVRLLLSRGNVSIFICISGMIIFFPSVIDSSYTQDILTSVTLSGLSIILSLL